MNKSNSDLRKYFQYYYFKLNFLRTWVKVPVRRVLNAEPLNSLWRDERNVRTETGSRLYVCNIHRLSLGLLGEQGLLCVGVLLNMLMLGNSVCFLGANQ